MPLPGRGKSGGARVIYLYKRVDDQIYLLLAYSKVVSDDLTARQTRVLRDLAKQLMNE
ncbi:MAG: type II toxin-antitoxin system RelE/ParE family toxin [Sphingomonadaceae bacterium]